MWKPLTLGILTSLMSPLSVWACSCLCNFEHSVSEYLENHAVFWGISTGSRFSDEDYLVMYEVEIAEGYGKLAAGNKVSVVSSPEDGSTCGTQLNTGVLEFITAYRKDGVYSVSTCNCQPPSAYLLQYLTEGQDTYLPNLHECWADDDEDNRFKATEKCRVWRDAPEDWQFEGIEEQRIRKLLQKKRAEQAE